MEVGLSSNFLDLDFSELVLRELLDEVVEVALYPPGEVKAAAEMVPADTVVVALVPITLTVWTWSAVTVDAGAV